jgi:hypothetical protein
VFSTARVAPARVELLDVQGRLVRTLLDTPSLSAGAHTLELDVQNGREPLRGGVYFYRLITPEATRSGRLVVLD